MKTITAMMIALFVCLSAYAGEKAEKADELKPQTVCPVMGGKIDECLFVDHDGQRVYVCCAGCIKPLEKSPEKFIKKMAKNGEAPAKIQTVCPVMGGKINKKQFVDHDGKRIYVCCPGCIPKIKADPEKYIGKLEKEGIVLDKVPDDKKEEKKNLHSGHKH